MYSIARIILPLCLGASLLKLSIAGAAPDADTAQRLQRLEDKQQRLAEQLRALQDEIETIKRQMAAPEAKQPAGELDVDALRAAAEAAAAESAEEQQQAEEQVFTNRNRLMSAANPELSFIFDMTGTVNDNEGEDGIGEPPFVRGRDRFSLTSAEMSLQMPVDPFSVGKAFIEVGPGGAELEEAYLDFANLGGWGLRIGQMRPNIGLWNRVHEHALPQVDLPRIYSWSFEEGSVRELGVEASRLLSSLFRADSNQLTLSLFNGQNELIFAGAGFDRPAAGLRLSNYYDLNQDTFFQWDVGGLFGYTDPDGNNKTWLGTLGLVYDWTPAGQAKYRGFTARSELFYRHREQSDFIDAFKAWRPAGLAPATAINSWGGYLFVERKFARNWTHGLRLDYVQVPDRSREHEWGISPYITFWQSEATRWRLQLSHYGRNFLPDENVLFLQLDFGFGPHRHDQY